MWWTGVTLGGDLLVGEEWGSGSSRAPWGVGLGGMAAGSCVLDVQLWRGPWSVVIRSRGVAPGSGHPFLFFLERETRGVRHMCRSEWLFCGSPLCIFWSVVTFQRVIG